MATSLVFAAGAFFALLLVGPRYEASVILAFDDSRGPGLEQRILLAQLSAPGFSSDVAARLAHTSDETASPSLLDRIIGLLEGDTFVGGRDASAKDETRGISVSGGPRTGEVRVSASAASPGEAEALVAAAAAVFVDRAGAQSAPRQSERDMASLDRSRQAVVELRERWSALSDEQVPSDMADRRRSLEHSARDVREAIGRVDAQRTILDALSRDPASDIALETVQDPVLREAVNAFRELAMSVEELNPTLPEGSPRTRIARLRLDQLGEQLALRARAALDISENEREALSRRLSVVEADGERLEREATADRARADERRALALELAAAEASHDALATAEQAAEADWAPDTAQVLSTPRGARRATPPFLTVTGLAALAGLFVGSLGSALAALTSARFGSDGREGHASAALPFRETGWPDVVSVSAQSPGREDRTPALGHDSMTTEEAVSALLASRISRGLIIACQDEGRRSISLYLARRLAEKGRLVLLIDLSPSQRAMREAGVPADTMGLSEVTAHSLGLSSVVIADEVSSVDLVTSGLKLRKPAAGRAKAEALRYASRAYDHVLVDCGLLPVGEVIALADENCAILLDAADVPAELVAERLRELDAAKLDTAVLSA